MLDSDIFNKKKHKYNCSFCGYNCDTKFLFKQHCSTKKHIKNEAANIVIKKKRYTCDCGKTYTHVQSYNRHVASCNKELITSDQMQKIDGDLRNILTHLITQNQNILMENKEMREMVKDMIPKIGTTVINNKFNLQLFLNEKCKDAINLSEFVENLKLNLDDLNKTRNEGYISGITNIFVKRLRELDLHKRPIHCCDLKREVLYVRANNEWGKDNVNKDHIKGAINVVARKQIGLIKSWEAANPGWNNTDEGAEQYIQMIHSITNPGNENKSEEKIIRTIAKEVLIEK